MLCLYQFINRNSLIDIHYLRSIIFIYLEGEDADVTCVLKHQCLPANRADDTDGWVNYFVIPCLFIGRGILP